ncbi:MAG: hypothetical protein JSR53_01085 [Proteobacteria bacterium]|nr:hypothetical protein [Pseudomonadota bacterium]
MAAFAHWRNALGALLLALWALSAHLASSRIGPMGLHIVIAVAPLWLAAALAALQTPWPRSGAALVTLASVAALMAAWRWLHGHLPWLYYLQHLGAHLALAAFFARSLGAGREPVVSAMARLITPGPLSVASLRYTRGVTLAWALFLAGNALVSTLLFAWAPAEVWSVHANLLTGPLMAGFFGLEMLARRWALPPEERPTIRAVVRAWRAHRGQAGQAPAPRHIA